MDLQQAVRTRRTHKAYAPEPVAREILDELFELARWAPNHKLTNPWRFRVIGPQARERLKRAADAMQQGAGRKLDRAPTLVLSTAKQTSDPVGNEEDLLAAAIASYIVLLGAHDRGLVGYWRTPSFLRDGDGLAALAVPSDERLLGLLHLGHPLQSKDPPERAPVSTVVEYLP